MHKNKLKRCLINLLKLNLTVIDLYETTTDDEKVLETYKRARNDTLHSIEVIKGIKHEEILMEIYSSFVIPYESVLANVGVFLANENGPELWDSSEDEFKKFQDLVESNRKEYEKEQEEKRKTQELIAKAKQDGKKVELVYDESTKKMKPIVVEEC